MASRIRRVHAVLDHRLLPPELGHLIGFELHFDDVRTSERVYSAIGVAWDREEFTLGELRKWSARCVEDVSSDLNVGHFRSTDAFAEWYRPFHNLFASLKAIGFEDDERLLGWKEPERQHAAVYADWVLSERPGEPMEMPKCMVPWPKSPKQLLAEARERMIARDIRRSELGVE